MFVKSACVRMIMVMNWSLELLLILKNYELKFGITFNSQKLLFQNQFYTFLWGFLSSKIFIHISIHSLFNFIQKKIYAKIMAPEHIWYSIMNFQISIQKCFVINIYSLVLANTCVLSIFLLGYFALIFLWVLLWFFMWVDCFLPICRRRRRRTPMNRQRSA